MTGNIKAGLATAGTFIALALFFWATAVFSWVRLFLLISLALAFFWLFGRLLFRGFKEVFRW